MMRRIAFVGVSHWHLPLYIEPVLALPDAEVIGVTDPDPAVAARVGARLGCPGWTEWERVLDAKPDFVFVLGRHCDMAAVMALVEAAYAASAHPGRRPAAPSP